MYFMIIIIVTSLLLVTLYESGAKKKKISELDSMLKESNKKIVEKTYEISELLSKNRVLKETLAKRLNPSEERLGELNDEIELLVLEKNRMNDLIAENLGIYDRVNEAILRVERLDKQEITQKNKIKKLKELYKSITYSIDEFFKLGVAPLEKISQDITEIIPEVQVELKLHHMDVKSLNKLFKENNTQIEKVLEAYEVRYTTKNNKTIYHLMVMALKAELQNILYDLKYEKLATAIENIKSITAKYLKLADEGNRTITNTMIRFIGQIEYLFINAAKIEYNYYVKKEQARQEQLAIRQQMREEAEERRALKLERDRIEAEENKYKMEIERAQELLGKTEDNSEIDALNKKILELQSQLSDVVIKKEDIINLQNGKAGNVYVISNLGSFGDKMFKIGMTRRLDPQERINELGSASVPFKFDVHSFIFSEDAVNLEKALHQRLDDKRVNRVNLRKEFFYSTLEELEELVNELDPTAEFNKTMIAEEYYQTLSSDENYSTNELDDNDNEDEELE